MRLKIAVVAACPLPCPRGTPIRILRLSEALASLGHLVHVVTYHLGTEYSSQDPNLRIHRIRDVPGYTKMDPGPSWQKLLLLDVMLTRRLRQLLRDEPIDLIHAHHYEGLLTARWARGRSSVPVVYDAHTLLATELPYYGFGVPFGVKSAFGRALDQRLPVSADGIVCVTPEIEQSLAPLMNAPDRIITIPNGVELDAFSVRRGYQGHGPNGEGGEKCVLYAGTLADYQGIGLMLSSFARVAKQRPDVKFRIVSDGDFSRHEQQIRKLGIQSKVEMRRASFRELVGLIAEADVAVNPRIDGDGLPQKNLNYLAAGVPIVSFKGSAKQLVDGETAYIVPDGDEAQFATAICRAIDNPVEAAAMGERGRAYVERHCSWDLAAQTAELFFKFLVRECSLDNRA